jgi:hypothetical protein
MSYKVDQSNTMDSEARKQVLPKMTAPMAGKVLGSSSVADSLDRIDYGVPREGNSNSITTSTPIESKRMSGNSSPSWPANKGSMMFYGKGPR